MYPHGHFSFDLDGVLERPGRYRDRLPADETAPTAHIDLFVGTVTVHIRAEVEAGPIKLLER